MIKSFMFKTINITYIRVHKLLKHFCRILINTSPEQTMNEIRDQNVVDSEQSSEYSVIKEGKADIIQESFVFYNRVQEFNRDLSVLAINTFLKNQLWKNGVKENKWIKDKITILDALSATGLRSMRYALECNQCVFPIKIVANDLSKKAIETIEKNIDRNNARNIVECSHSDAAMFMYRNRDLKNRFSIVDLDPYGSPAPFLDSAVQSVSDGGLLLITCTDMAVLCGNHSETCHAKYGSISLRSKFCHEMALRIILRSVESHANRYGRYIEPLVSISVDFYVRIVLRIHTSPYEVKRSASKLAHLYLCTGCESFELQRLTVQKNSEKEAYNFVPATAPIVAKLCDHCGHHYRMGGPIWAHPIHSPDFIEQMQKELLNTNEDIDSKFGTHKRLEGILQVLHEELTDCPLYYCLDRLCRVVQCRMPSMKTFRSAILNAGFDVSYSHASKTSIKTNAPNCLIWDIMRKIEKDLSKNNLSEKSAGFEIINKNSSHEISFEMHPKAEPLSKELQLLRYQINPDSDWGPKSRPSKLEDKRARNQGKRSRNSDDNQSSKKLSQ